MMVPAIADTGFAECLEGALTTATTAGYALAVTQTGYDPDREEGAASTFLEQGARGLILSVQDANASALLGLLDRHRTPYVLVYNQPSERGRATVGIDARAAAHELMETAILYGHRTVALVVPSLRASDRSIRRLEGYRAALKAHAIPNGPIVELSGQDPDDLTRAMADVLQDVPRPSVLFCPNDMLALALLQTVRSLGYAVPRDLSIIGFDGLPIGTLIEPTLAGVCLPHRDIGRRACALLIDRIEKAAPPATVVLPHTIRRGGTLGRWAPDASGAGTGWTGE